MILESKFQKELIDDLKELFPGSIILKNDPNYIQGIPDLTIFYLDRWATLEVKTHERASHQPNQDYYVNIMNAMSYSAFVYPENKEEVMDGLQHAFRAKRKTRLPERK